MCCITLFVVGINGYSQDILGQIISTYGHRQSCYGDEYKAIRFKPQPASRHSRVRLPEHSKTSGPLSVRCLRIPKTGVTCQLNEYLGVRRREIIYPIEFLQNNPFVREFEPGCFVVAAWTASAIYLCHEVRYIPEAPSKLLTRSKRPEPVTIASQEIGRIALEGTKVCWTRVFKADVKTTQGITVRLQRPG